MNGKAVRYISYGTLLIGAVICVYVFVDIFLLKARLHAGVCPVLRNRPLLYAGIALCLISFVFSFFEPKRKGERKK